MTFRIFKPFLVFIQFFSSIVYLWHFLCYTILSAVFIFTLLFLKHHNNKSLLLDISRVQSQNIISHFHLNVDYSGFLIRHPVCMQTAVEINQLIYNVDRNKYIVIAACSSLSQKWFNGLIEWPDMYSSSQVRKMLRLKSVKRNRLIFCCVFTWPKFFLKKSASSGQDKLQTFLFYFWLGKSAYSRIEGVRFLW